MPDKPLELPCRNRFPLFCIPALTPEACHHELIGDDLHGHGDIQRTVVGVCGNLHEVMAEGEFLIRQARTLPAEQQCHLRTGCGTPGGKGSAFTRVDHRPAHRALARARADHQLTVPDGFCKRLDLA